MESNKVNGDLISETAGLVPADVLANIQLGPDSKFVLILGGGVPGKETVQVIAGKTLDHFTVASYCMAGLSSALVALKTALESPITDIAGKPFLSRFRRNR